MLGIQPAHDNAVLFQRFQAENVFWTLAVAEIFRPGAASRVPVLPIAIFVPVLVGLVLLTRPRRIAAVLDATPPGWLIGLQVYRVLGGIFLVQWATGNLSGVFALPAGTGDVLVGLLALPVAYYLHSGAPGGRIAARLERAPASSISQSRSAS